MRIPSEFVSSFYSAIQTVFGFVCVSLCPLTLVRLDLIREQLISFCVAAASDEHSCFLYFLDSLLSGFRQP